MTIRFGSPRFERAIEITGARPMTGGMRRGSFYLHALIAQGGQAEVYLATGDTLARTKPCVVKAFKESDRDTIDRARRSIDAQLRLLNASRRGVFAGWHSWVPDILAWDVDGLFGPWVAQDFRGVSLRKYLGGRVRPARVIDVAETPGPGTNLGRGDRVLIDFVRAVQFVHSQGVLHRDLKPENVLIETWRPRSGVVLCDFDLARGDDQPTITQTGAVMGTPGYSAPEQMLGLARATTASDVYSVGMLAIFLVTGREPWEATIGPNFTSRKLDPEIGGLLGEKRSWVESAISFIPEERPLLSELLEILPSEVSVRGRFDA